MKFESITCHRVIFASRPVIFLTIFVSRPRQQERPRRLGRTILVENTALVPSEPH